MPTFVLKPVLLLACVAIARAEPDFRPELAAALKRGEKHVVLPPGTYRLAPENGGKVVWTLQGLKDVEIIAERVTLISTKLTRAVAIDHCSGVTLRGLSVDYDPLPFTQGTVSEAAGDQSWIEVKLHAGYPAKPYARIDVVDPATRFRKKGMPFLWGTRAEMKGEDSVRVFREKMGAAAKVGDLASLNTGPATDGIPHALSIEHCESITLDQVTIHSAPGMGILEADGEGKTRYLQCKVLPGPPPVGAKEERILSTSWDAMQTKTVRVGPRVEGCEIRDAGDDSWSVQSSDFMVLKRTGKTLVLASRDEFTSGVQAGDGLQQRVGGEVARIVSRRDLSHAQAELAPEVAAKLQNPPSWSEWKVSPRCIEVVLDAELPLSPGDSLFSPDRMGNGFEFINNRIRSSGRVLIKAAGRIEGNVFDTPHALTVCPELPGNAAAGIDGLVIRKNTIRRAGWFCPAPWSASAGALSITAGAKPPEMRAAGVFANLVIEDNLFEDCEGPNLVLSSTKGAVIRDNRFVRALPNPPPDTGTSYGIPKDAILWISECEGVKSGNNSITEPGAHAGPTMGKGKNVSDFHGE